VTDINKSLSTSVRDAKISALQPPPIDNLGNSSGFSFRLQDRAQKGYADLMAAKDQLLIAAKKSPILQDVYQAAEICVFRNCIGLSEPAGRGLWCIIDGSPKYRVFD
jgi:hypothetical protein